MKTQQQRIEASRWRRFYLLRLKFIREKNRNEVLAVFRAHPKNGSDHYYTTGIIVPPSHYFFSDFDGINVSDFVLMHQLNKIRQQTLVALKSIIWNGGTVDHEVMIEILKATLDEIAVSDPKSDGYL